MNEKLILQVIAQVKSDVHDGDVEALGELLNHIPEKVLIAYLPEHLQPEVPETGAKIKKVCRTCGSEDVLADAYVEWDFENQEWVLSSVYDKGHYCSECDGECSIDDKTEEK